MSSWACGEAADPAGVAEVEGVAEAADEVDGEGEPALSPGGAPAAVAGQLAIGSPIDLAIGQIAIDSRTRWLYRRNVLRSLCSSAAGLEESGRLTSPLAAVLRVRTLREWDRLMVAPRFGFDGPDGYYASESAASHLPRLAVPGLYVGAEHDPIVPAETVRPALRRASASLDVRWVRRAGHIGFPANLDIGEPGFVGFEPQLLSWLERTG